MINLTYDDFTQTGTFTAEGGGEVRGRVKIKGEREALYMLKVIIEKEILTQVDLATWHFKERIEAFMYEELQA